MDKHVTFNSDYVGKLLQPNIANSSTVAIFDWDNMTNTLYVQGDITSYVAAGDAYRVEMPDGGAGVEECNSGFWDAAPAYASGETTFTAVQTAHFRDFQAGWLLIPDVTKPAYVRIKEIDATDDFKLTVEGDVTDLAGAGARFRVV
ncbi:MAG: hypothetical protein IT464_07825, partial [Planctomycetes bacterium]|nr:hypothetical protein [Planctomycetota bacterium]